MPYNRIIRGEILNSERVLDLSSDTARWVYLALLLEADDFGNVQGGDRRLFRWAHQFSQVKTEPDMVRLMMELQDADLARHYEVDGKPYWHLPRTKNQRRWTARLWPASPWDDPNLVTTIERRRIAAKGTETSRSPAASLPQVEAQNEHNQGPEDQTCDTPAASLQQEDSNPDALLLRGVGVGVGVGVGKRKKTGDRKDRDHLADTSLGSRWAKDRTVPDDWLVWAINHAAAQNRAMPWDHAQRIAEQFADHWVAQPGAKGRKADWQATWRKWVRTEVQRLPANRTDALEPTAAASAMRRAV